MEPILIANLKKEIQTALLNAQNTNEFNLNPNKNAYIEEDEVDALLKFFGAQKIEDLMDTGFDTFKSSETNNTVTVANEEENHVEETDINSEQEKDEEQVANEDNSETVNAENNKNTIMDKIKDIVERDNARNELIISDSGDVELQDPANPLHNIYEASKNNLGMQSFVREVSEEIQKIEDEVKENAMTEENTVNYKDANGNEKALTIRQTVSIGGTVSRENNSDDEGGDGGDNEGGDGGDDGERISLEDGTDDQDKPKNILNGGIHYTLVANTDNTKFGFKAHIDNTDQDFLAYIAHDKTLKNSGKLGLTGSARATIDQGTFNGSGGLAVDYSNENISTGIYGHVDYESTSENNSLGYDAKTYVNYKKLGGLYVGIAGEPKNYYTPYAGINLYGIKKLNNGLSLQGAVSADATFYHIGAIPGNDTPDMDLFNAKISAKGGLSFKANDDINASLDAILIYESLSVLNSDSKPIQNFGAAALGRFRKGKTEVYATGCIYKDIGTEDKLLVGAATFGIQVNDLIKKGLAAYIEGTVCNDTKANTNPDSSINGIKVGSRLNF